MKKLLVMATTVVMLLNLVGCNDTSEVDNTQSAETSTSIIVTTPPAKTNPPSVTTKNYQNEAIEYICDRSIQYDSVKKCHTLLFGFTTSDGTYVSASGKVSAVVVDKSDTKIYEKEISFSSSNFSTWTNSFRDSSRYLCGLEIKDSEIQGSASEMGTLKFKVTLSDGTYFDESELSISDLPSLSVKIKLPTVPSTYNDSRYYSHKSTVSVTTLTYESESRYDGTSTVKFNIVLKLMAKTSGTNTSDTVAIGYKLYDSNNVVISSGHIYSDPIAIGESCKADFYVYELNPRETYTLKFLDAK